MVGLELGNFVFHFLVLVHEFACDLLVFGDFTFISFVSLLGVIQNGRDGLSEHFKFIAQPVNLVETRRGSISHLLEQEVSLPLERVLEILVLLQLEVQLLKVILLLNPKHLELLLHPLRSKLQFDLLLLKALHQVNDLFVVVFHFLFQTEVLLLSLDVDFSALNLIVFVVLDKGLEISRFTENLGHFFRHIVKLAPHLRYLLICLTRVLFHLVNIGLLQICSNH